MAFLLGRFLLEARACRPFEQSILMILLPLYILLSYEFRLDQNNYAEK